MLKLPGAQNIHTGGASWPTEGPRECVGLTLVKGAKPDASLGAQNTLSPPLSLAGSSAADALSRVFTLRFGLKHRKRPSLARSFLGSPWAAAAHIRISKHLSGFELC